MREVVKVYFKYIINFTTRNHKIMGEVIASISMLTFFNYLLHFFKIYSGIYFTVRIGFEISKNPIKLFSVEMKNFIHLAWNRFCKGFILFLLCFFIFPRFFHLLHYMYFILKFFESA